MRSSVLFFTVCGGGDDYDFLLGAIERHAEMGRHLVLDTTPEDRAVKFQRLPDTVVWMHEPLYGAGWKDIRLRTAVERAMRLGRLMSPDILVYLDSDEFYINEAPRDLFPYAMDAMVEVNYTHWRKDGHAYIFGPSEWHRRLWPAGSDVTIAQNTAWVQHPQYNGNPEHHPVPSPPANLPIIRVQGNFRHHLHYALGSKADDDETARTTIAGWPDGGARVPAVPWPAKLALWRDQGIRPSEFFR